MSTSTKATKKNNKLLSILRSSWGPTDDAIPSFSGLPFVPYNKRDPIDFIANWDSNATTTTANKSKQRRPRHTSNLLDAQNISQLGVFSDEDAKSYTSEYSNDGFITKARKQYNQRPKWRGPSKEHRLNVLESKNRIYNNINRQIDESSHSHHISKKKKLKKLKKKKQRENPRPNEPSIYKKDSWIHIKDIWFNDIFHRNVHKLNYMDPKCKKLILAGNIHGVLTKYDGMRYQPQLLQSNKYKNIESFDHMAATQDPYIMEIMRKKKGNIYTTDNVLSAIMCCERSKYSFDIVINKIGDYIFLDERNKILSNYSVDETSPNRPTKYKQPYIDYHSSLSREATDINHIFKEQMLYHRNLEYTQKLKRSHPFKTSKESNKASSGFSYNLFDITDNIQVICRCDIDGYIVNKNKSKKKDWVKVCALNQYNFHKSKKFNWRKCLDKKETSIISQEIRNNNFKCARWGIKAKLSDSKYVKLGFITRSKSHSIDKHEIIGVKTYETRNYLKRLRIEPNMNQSWNVFIRFIECIKNIDGDGRFIAIRDPIHQVFKIYNIQNDTFKEDGLQTFGELKKRLNL